MKPTRGGDDTHQARLGTATGGSEARLVVVIGDTIKNKERLRDCLEGRREVRFRWRGIGRGEVARAKATLRIVFLHENGRKKETDELERNGRGSEFI